MKALLLLALAAAQPPEVLLQQGTDAYREGDAIQATRAFEQLALLAHAAPYLRAQAHQGLAALAQRRGSGDEAAAHVEQAVATCDVTTCDAPLRAAFEEARGVLRRGAGDAAGAAEAFGRCAALDVDRACDAALARLCHHALGKVVDAPLHYRRALRAESAQMTCAGDGCVLRVPLLNDAAVALEATGSTEEAVQLLREAVRLDPLNDQAIGNLALYLRDLGDFDESLAWGRRGVAVAPHSSAMLHNVALLEHRNRNVSGAVLLWRRARDLQSGVFQPVASLAHQEGYRGNLSGAALLYEEALELAQASAQWRSHADALRLQLATSQLPHIYDDAEHAKKCWFDYTQGLRELLRRPSLRIEDPLHTTGAGALGYYLEYVGLPDLPPRRLLASVYWKGSPELKYRATWLGAAADEGYAAPHIRVGFLTAFYFRHSVGLLTEGVIRTLNRGKFRVVLLRVEGEPTDELTGSLARACDEVYVVPSTSIQKAQLIVEAARVDVLVFCEIGMNSMSYFLLFARLARRQVLFWGHAVTSGVSQFDTDHTPGVGGGDYFVSSTLFEPRDEMRGQDDYAEQLYLMRGLTTRFLPPVQPRLSLSIQDVLPGFKDNQRLYLVPQTLYKLHPDFDVLLAEILRRDRGAVVAFPEAQVGEWTEALERRWNRTLTSDIRGRVRVFRRLEFDEFVQLAQLCHVVLDPFPVGGGRSSLELFSVGAPIVMLEPRTSIVQLTRGMYEAMGDPCPRCIAQTPEAFVASAVWVATNASQELRSVILQRKHLLYDASHVTAEWETFLEYILERPRPSKPPRRALVAPETNRWGFALRPFGWELKALAPGEPYDAQIDWHSLHFGLRLSHPDPWTGVVSEFVVAVYEGEEPLDVASKLSTYINAEPVKARWLANVLQNGARRGDDVAHSSEYILDDVTLNITVFAGDDLHQLATFHAVRAGLNDGAIHTVASALKAKLPEAASSKWLATRRKRDHLNTGDPVACFQEPLRNDPWTEPAACVVTVGLTTCKRLRHFRLTMQGLRRVFRGDIVDHALVCRVIVIDDGSSEADRLVMMREFPRVDFLLKNDIAHKGHAHSMNTLLRMVATPYLLYMEDDWLALDHVTSLHVLDEALHVLRASSSDEPVVEVLLNDQSSRSCAYASEEDCPLLGSAGWPRLTNGTNYRLHDYGTVEPGHAFTYWPGFSLNPGLWDVRRLACAFDAAFGEGPVFNTSDARFEQSFSLRAYDAGLRVAYLPRVSFAHTGVDESAYGLNNVSRPFDGQVGGALK